MNPIKSAGVVIRRVGLNRIDDLLLLEDICFEYDRTSRRNMRRLLQSPSVHFIGAYCSGELVGFIALQFRRNSRSVRLSKVAVRPDFQGQGIGRRLLSAAERKAKSLSCVRIRLEVRMDNIRAINLYEQLGYIDEQILPGCFEDGSHGIVCRKQLV